MSETVIQRVARAIYSKWREIESAQTTFDEMVVLAGKDNYAGAKRIFHLAHEEARAAVEALRETTEGMREASYSRESEMGFVGNLAPRGMNHSTIWETMISAILTEGQPAAPAPARPAVRSLDGAPVPADYLIMIAAFRYALGRMTYMVGHVAEWIAKHADTIPMHDAQLIIREIDEAGEQGGLGMQMDERVWRRLQETLRVSLAAVPAPVGERERHG